MNVIICDSDSCLGYAYIYYIHVQTFRLTLDHDLFFGLMMVLYDNVVHFYNNSLHFILTPKYIK